MDTEQDKAQGPTQQDGHDDRDMARCLGSVASGRKRRVPVRYRRCGVPITCTEALTRRIERRVLAGATPRAASMAEGVPERIFREWVAWANEGREPWASWWGCLEMAEAEVECQMAERLCAAGATDWRAAESYLERRNPEVWSRTESRRVQIGGDLGVEHVGDERIAELCKNIIARLSERAGACPSLPTEGGTADEMAG